jgi:hypothetical protein
MRAYAPNQFNKRCCAGWSGIERDRVERNFWRQDNDEVRNGKIGIDRIDNRWRGMFYETGGQRSQTFAARLTGGLFLFVWFGWMRMKRALVLHDMFLRSENIQCAVIGNRDPGKDRHRDDQATRSCFHIGSIADAARMLKCFLFDP